MSKRKYYSLDKIKALKCQYSLIFGERSNGKTYACLKEILELYKENGWQGAYIRRWDEDIQAKRMMVLFDGHVKNGTVSKIFKSEWTDVYYYAGKFFLCRYEDGKRISDQNPFCYCFSLSAMEHDKSTSYPSIFTIVFDEFLTRGMYLNNEYVLLMNVLSTIIRDRTGISIYLLGNTVNKYSPYWDEFGISKHIQKMKQGDIEVVKYGESGLRMAIEYADSPNKDGKPSDVYFAFDSPSVKMITQGNWETAMYPHLMRKYKPMDVIFQYFIVFQDATLHCEVIDDGEVTYTYIHDKTTKIKNPEDDLIFSFDDSPLSNHRRNLTKPIDRLGKKILDYFVNGVVYYQNNDIGEVVRNYLLQCRNDSIIK